MQDTTNGDTSTIKMSDEFKFTLKSIFIKFHGQ